MNDTAEPRTFSELPAHRKNPRKLSAKARIAMEKSYAQFGDLSGIIFNRRSNQLLGGHQRQKLFSHGQLVITERMETPDSLGTVARGYVQTGDDRIPYREVDWPETKEKAALLAANKHGGEFAKEALSELLSDLERSQENYDFDVTGFFDDALAEARKQAYDSLSKLNRELERAENENSTGIVEKPADTPKAGKPEPMTTALLAVSLTAQESALWSEIKKHLGERDDKTALLKLIRERLNPV